MNISIDQLILDGGRLEKMVLFKLLKLQEIDKRLMELDSLKGDLPEQVQDLRNRLSRLTGELSHTVRELEEVKKLNRSVEMDIRSLSDKLKKYQEQIYSVKTNKEYDAITVEIENLEKQIEQRELKGVESLEKEEQLTAEASRLENQLAELNRALNEKEQELQEKLRETEVEQKALLGNRSELVAMIDHRFFATYERIRKGRNGIALAEIEHYTCSACNATIPAQTVVEVRKMDHMITCEVCGRILVVTNNQGAKPTEAISQSS